MSNTAAAMAKYKNNNLDHYKEITRKASKKYYEANKERVQKRMNDRNARIKNEKQRVNILLN